MLHVTTGALKYCGALASCAAIALCTLYVIRPTAQGRPQVDTVANAGNASPIYGVTIPPGYRDWKLIAVDQLVVGKLDQLRAQLGNEIAIQAFKEGKVPFPDGAIVAALHWNRVSSEDNNEVLDGAFPSAQSFVTGAAVNVQFMVKDSEKYVATGVGDSLTSRTENLATRHCTKLASPATSLPKLMTSSSSTTRLRSELKHAAAARYRKSRSNKYA